jgi:FkbM family methyltransferase
MNRSLLAETNGEHWIIKYLPAEPFVLDVGFNKGDYSSEILKQRPKARVIGFEPAKSMQQLFQKNFAKELRIQLLPLALSNVSGELEFRDTADGCSSLAVNNHAGNHYRVKTVSLDEIAKAYDFPQINMLKIDVEGYDLHVLEGASGLLDKQLIDIFTFEYNAPWIDSRRFLKDACNYIDTKPYSLFRLFNGFLVPFRYNHVAERHDLACNYIGISTGRLEREDIPIKSFPLYWSP